MKALAIARQSLVRSFRSSFLIGMMFVAPLLLTGLLYFAFGNLISSSGSLTIPTIHVRLANLDRPAPDAGLSAGNMVADFLQDEALAALLDVQVVDGESRARAAVEQGKADVAVIVPENLTAAVQQPGVRAHITVYADPAQTIAPPVVKSLLSDFLDGFAGAKIAVEVAEAQTAKSGQRLAPEAAQAVAQQYASWVQTTGHSHDGRTAIPIVLTRAPQDTRPLNAVNSFLGPIMAGMLVLFVFFTAGASAQSILSEQEEGTLARLYTTPTSNQTILGGKCAAVFLTVLVQIAVLLIASALLFGIRWGDLGTITLASLGLAAAATGFGLLVISFIKTTRQAGPISAGVMVITGILAGLIPTGDPTQGSPFDTIGLALPQGWALHAFKLALSGETAVAVLLPFVVLAGAGLLCFAIGARSLSHRFQ